MPAHEIDFSNVKERAGRLKVTPGDYLFKISSVEETKSKAGNPMWVFDQEILPGFEGAGQSIRDYVSLTPQALFKLRDLLEALGVSVGKKKIKVDPQKLVGKIIGGHVEDGEPYGEREIVKSEIAYYLPKGDVAPPSKTAPADDEGPVDGETPEADAEPATEADVTDELAEFDLDSI